MEKNLNALEGTSFRSGRLQNELSELDSLIQETLKESKIKEKPAISEQKPEVHFAATPITIESKSETPAVEHPVAVKEPPKKDSTQQQYEKTFRSYKEGDIVKGIVAKIDPSGILVDIGYKADGFVSNEEEMLRDDIKVGDSLEVYIKALSTKNGYAALSLKQAAIEKKWIELLNSFKNHASIEAKVTSAVGGGLVVDSFGIRGFIPASQVTKKFETSLSDFVGKIIPVQVIEIDRRRGKVILSHKLGNFEKQKMDREKIFNQMEVGEVLRGTVSSIKKFGAFVNISGIEGLIHINDLSWKRVNDPSAIVSIGQEIDVFVLGVDRINKKLSLGLKQLEPDPWVIAAEKYKPGQTVKVKVLRLAKFGAFVELEDGIEGLVHNSELSMKGVEKPEDAVKIGDTIDVVILRISPDEQRIGLSVREALIKKEKEELKEVQSQSAPQKITIGDSIGENIKEQLFDSQ